MEVRIEPRHGTKGVAWVITTRIPNESGVGVVRFVRGTYSEALVEMFHFLNITRIAQRILANENV